MCKKKKGKKEEIIKNTVVYRIEHEARIEGWLVCSVNSEIVIISPKIKDYYGVISAATANATTDPLCQSDNTKTT